jgi:hypothetical protein
LLLSLCFLSIFDLLSFHYNPAKNEKFSINITPSIVLPNFSIFHSK